MIDGSEARKTRRNEKDQPNNLRQRLSCCSFSAFCSFYELPDDVSWAWDESLWPVPALFHAVVAVQPAWPTSGKRGGGAAAPAPTSPPWGGGPTGASTPPPTGAPATREM